MQRDKFFEQITFQFSVHSVCGLLGPRQVGKTTLAKQFAAQYARVQFIDLENPMDLASLDNPMVVLSNLDKELIVIDEVQYRPDLFPILRVLVDDKPRKFLILGSASRDLLQQSSETLAGRIGYVELPTFALAETQEYKTLWIRGGFPRSYLAPTDLASRAWRMSYVSTFMERDIPALGFNVPPVQMRQLWMMLAHSHGGILNASELGVSLGFSHHTVRKYIDILAGTFMIRLLPPWFENIAKRQVKSPKIYVRDSGLLHTLLGIHELAALHMHPKLGASWEGFAVEEVIKYFQAGVEECFFWRTHDGAELDLLIMKDGKRVGFEFKYSDAPKVTKSMHVALESLKLDHLFVVHPHDHEFELAPKITARSIQFFMKNSPSLI